MKMSLFAQFIKFRRGIAAVSSGLAVVLVTGLIAGRGSDQIDVVVARHNLAAGTTVQASDLIKSKLATDAPWHGMFTTTHQVVGRTTSHAISVGQPLSRSDTVGADLLKGFKRGTVALELSQSQISNTRMLQAGQHIDLYSSDHEYRSDAKLIAHDVVVLAHGTAHASGLSSGGLSSGGLNVTDQTAALLIALSPQQATKVALEMSRSQLVSVLLNR